MVTVFYEILGFGVVEFDHEPSEEEVAVAILNDCDDIHLHYERSE